MRRYVIKRGGELFVTTTFMHNGQLCKACNRFQLPLKAVRSVVGSVVGDAHFSTEPSGKSLLEGLEPFRKQVWFNHDEAIKRATANE